MSRAGWRLLAEHVAERPDRTWIDVRPGEVTLYLEGLGRCHVDADGASFGIADEQDRPALEDTLGPWAWGVWLGLQGQFAFHGATLEREGLGMAIFGGARSAISLAALSLVRRGWSLIADDVCPLAIDTDHVLALPGAPEIRVDTLVAEHIPDIPRARILRTPRSRTAIPVESAGPARITHMFTVVTTNTKSHSRLVTPPHADQVSTLVNAASVGQALLSATPGLRQSLDRVIAEALALVPMQALLTPRTWTPDSFSPQQLADLLEGAVRS